MTDQLQILPAGDQALVVQLADRIDAGVNAQVIALAAALDRAKIAGVTDRVPTYRSLLVRYDPARIRGARLEELLRGLLSETAETAAPGRLWRIPVWYGGPAALDLEALAEEKGLSTEALIALHSSAEYRVYMIGFAPGFAYLGGLPETLHSPRLAVPRQLIPAGAIGIGGQQASINSVAGPSGWRFLGATPVRLFEPERDPPILLTAGDRVRFEPIPAAQYDALTAEGFLPKPETGGTTDA